jgi:SAM-dependent methyltransferase
LPNKLGHVLVLRDLGAWLRIEFLGAAARTGLLAELARPRRDAELSSGVEDAGGLRAALLQLGESLGEISREGDRWALRGRRARAVVDSDGLAGMVEELVSYDADVYRSLPARLAGDPPGDYLAESGAVVARASRLAEPVLAALVGELVHRLRPARVLDVGCGTGVYLRHVGTSSGATGAGIDVDEEVVALARRNLSDWGLADRFDVEQADILAIPDHLAGPWDLVLLLQNIYYFPVSERLDVFRRLRRLAPAGHVVVATAVAGTGDPFAAHFDLVLRSTVGNYPLPTSSDISESMRAAGFPTVEVRHLAPGQPLRAFIASSAGGVDGGQGGLDRLG